MNDIIEAMKARRSCRSYKPDPVPQELLDQIIEAGLWAASGKNKQSTVILQVTDRALLDEISALNRGFGGWDKSVDPLYGAPALFIVLSKKDNPNCVPDGSLVMGNLMLAASALGLGSCWINRARQEFETDWGKALLARLGIEGEYEGIGHCIVGYPAATLAPLPRKPGRVYKV